jgi:hypothetical protein
MPLAVPQHDALGGRYEQEIPWDTRDADEQAEYLAMKCVRYIRQRGRAGSR